MIGYQVQRWNLALNVRNLTNKSYLSIAAMVIAATATGARSWATATYRW